MRIIQERGIEDQGQLMAALNEHNDYQRIMKDAKEISEALDGAQMNISTFQEYSEFLDIVGQAVQFLAQLLSSKTI